MTPTEWETIWHQLEDAFEVYGRKLKGRQTWVDVLFEHKFDDVQKAIKDWVSLSEQPPRPSQIVTEVKKLLHPRQKSTTVENDDDGECKEAPEIVKRAYMTWMRHSMGIAPPIPGTVNIEPLPLEEAVRVMKKSAIKTNQLHLLPPEIQRVEI